MDDSRFLLPSRQPCGSRAIPAIRSGTQDSFGTAAPERRWPGGGRQPCSGGAARQLTIRSKLQALTARGAEACCQTTTPGRRPTLVKREWKPPAGGTHRSGYRRIRGTGPCFNSISGEHFLGWTPLFRPTERSGRAVSRAERAKKNWRFCNGFAEIWLGHPIQKETFFREMAYGSTKLRAPREHLVSVPHIAHH